MKSKFDLSWGDPACVREIFLKYCNINYNIDQANGRYRFGDQCVSLENKTRILSKELLGVEHKYIIITNGAIQGLDASLSYYKDLGFYNAITRGLYFPYYPKIIEKHDLLHIKNQKITWPRDKTVEINDSPSNPEAIIGDLSAPSSVEKSIIWDAVYNNPIYKIFTLPPIKHNIALGSFGKLFGLPGLRIGWVGTNDPKIAKYITNHIEITTCGVSAPSQIMVEQILTNSSWLPMFFNEAAESIDRNKTEFVKVRHIFDGQIPPQEGMFFFPEVDPKALKILSKAGIKYTPGEVCGDTSGSRIRLNMAQTNEVVRQAVQSILKVDRS